MGVVRTNQGRKVEEGHLPHTALQQLPFRAEEIPRELQRGIHKVSQQLSCMEQFRKLFQENNPGAEGCSPEFRADYSQTGHV